MQHYPMNIPIFIGFSVLVCVILCLAASYVAYVTLVSTSGQYHLIDRGTRNLSGFVALSYLLGMLFIPLIALNFWAIPDLFRVELTLIEYALLSFLEVQIVAAAIGIANRLARTARGL
jgi:hypothetical protein